MTLNPTYDSAMTRIKKLVYKNRIRLRGVLPQSVTPPDSSCMHAGCTVLRNGLTAMLCCMHRTCHGGMLDLLYNMSAPNFAQSKMFVTRTLECFCFPLFCWHGYG